MTEFKPEDLHLQFEEAFNSGDLEALLALHVPDARLMSEPGQIVTGHAAIREGLKPALAIKGRLTVTTVYAVQAGDIAMMQAQSQLNGVTPILNGACRGRIRPSGSRAATFPPKHRMSPHP